MLRSFRVENHKSIRDEQELIFTPQYDKSKAVVPIAAIFGANASGKSNLLDALCWLQRAVRSSYAVWEAGTGVPRTPFTLDPEYAAKPSGYAVDLMIDGVRHDYGVVVDDRMVVEEWLSVYPHGRRRVIFQRRGSDVKLGSTVDDRAAANDLLARHTRDNALFLSVAAQNDVAEVETLYRWFRTGIAFGDADTLDEDELVRQFARESGGTTLASLIQAADLGLTDVTVYDFAAEIELHDPSGGPIRLRLVDGRWERSDGRRLDDVTRQRIYELGLRRAHVKSGLFFHHGVNNIPLLLEDQSAGTRSWIALVSQALTALEYGGLLAVDEVDASLHPHLSARLIGLFHDRDSNPSGAQLLFTTHDASLLDGNTLERDEIWFVEKDPASGASRLFALSEFHPRKNEDTEGRYLAGAYGAVPNLSAFEFTEPIRRKRGADAAA